MIHAPSVERPACSFARLRGKFPQLSLFSLKRQTPDALPLGWSIILKIIGHLMVHQSITVCRDVSRKPVHSVEQKGFRISARPLQRSTERKLEVKGKDHASKQSRECGAAHFNPCYIFIFLMSVKYLHHPTTLLFIPNTSTLTVTFPVLTGRQPIPCSR